MKKQILIFALTVVVGIAVWNKPVFAIDNQIIDSEGVGFQEIGELQENEQSQETCESQKMGTMQESYESQETEQSKETYDTQENDKILETEQLQESLEVYAEVKALSTSDVETKEMYRLYNPNSGEHFYTSDLNEKNHLVNVGWRYEGIGWKAPTNGVAVYRLYNPNAGDHHYTMDAVERDHLVSVGWNYEGIGWYSDSKRTVPIFRVYNPNAVTGTHHFTANYVEVEHLVSVGWNYEGVAWYSCDASWVDMGVEERIEISNIRETKGLFDVTINLARSANEISKVYVPVWTKSNQSDIYWYVASKQAGGSYKVTIDATKHQWNSGTYQVHCYVQTPQGDMKYIKETSVHMQLGTRAVAETLDDCSVRVTVWGLSNSIKKVQFPTWSVENDQDDIVWYQGTKNNDGSWSVDVHSKNHKNAGAYICDVYIKDGNSDVFMERVEFNIAKRLANTWIWKDGYKRYIGSNGEIENDVSRLVKGPYLIKVYKWSNYLIVFAKDENGNYNVPVKAMVTSCGNNTPTGTYYTPNKFRWLTMVGGSKAQWCTQISGDYLFHSVPYRIQDPTTLYTDIMFNYLGTTQSLGCIRLQAGDAKWIYDNCSLGTQVNITPYESGGPIAKPEFHPIPAWHTWDPTDPNVQYLCKQYGCH